VNTFCCPTAKYTGLLYDGKKRVVISGKGWKAGDDKSEEE
jgi:hypothetical protein